MEQDPFINITRKHLSLAFEFSFLSLLNEQEKFVICERYGFTGEDESPTLKTVGKSLSVSPERVRQIECKALRKLRCPQVLRLIKSYIVDGV